MPLTPLLGREREVKLACDMLARDGMRLVTLLGPGGIGKTRLALGIAAACAPAFDGQVAWAPVTTATSPESVAAALAHAVGITETGSTPTIDILKTMLGDVRLLLAVDNFEQALEAAPVLTDLLQACPGVSILVTSRAVLRVAGERPLEVPPLATAMEPADAESPREVAPAVLLFAQRAGSVLPSFALTPESIPVAEEICRRLDGLPLAIELAAARANTLPLRDLRDRLDSHLALLTGGARDMPARHRTMRDAIAWSYNLLTADQQHLFRSLAVFAGGFTFNAAAAVAIDVPDVLSALGVLIDNSLARLESSSQTGTRYTLLETVRQFAAEELDASGDEAPRQRHATYFLDLAHRVERTYWGDEPGDMRGQVRAEEANMRVAVGWAISHGDVDMAVHLAIAMFDPLSHTGDNAREQFLWLQRALALPGGSPSARAFALTRCAGLVRLEELDKGTALAEEAHALASYHDDAFSTADALRVLGNIAIHTGERDRARSSLLEALDGFRHLGVRGRAGWTLHHLSALEGIEANASLASAYCSEALDIFRDIGHARGVEATLSWHSECAFRMGDLPGALASAQEGLEMIRSDSWSYDYLDRIADIASAVGRAETAARLYGAANERRMRAARPIEPAFRDAHDARIDVARRAMGQEAFAAAYAAGRRLTQHQVEDEALGVSVPSVSPSGTDEPKGLLSPREMDVMRMLAAGLSDRAIADALFIGERTVNTHVGRIFAKLGVRNRAAAVSAAVEAGLVNPSPGSTPPG